MTSVLPSITHNTFVIERSYPKPPEHVFSAFADPAKKRRWYAEGDSHVVETFEMDFRVGGVERFQYHFNPNTPFPGVVVANEGSFQDIVPNRCIVLASTMSLAGKRISSTLVTVELLPTDSGTDLILTHQGAFYEGSDGPQMREAGWKSILGRLANAL